MASSSLSRLSADLAKSSKEFFIQSYSVKNVPLRIRPVIIVTLATWILILGVLGMAPIPEVPVNDKVLHFFGMGIATFLLYFVIDVPDSSRRIWYYRRAPMILTLTVGFLGGGILSELAQGYLPWKTFQWGDIAANLAGSTVAYFLAHTLLKQHRRQYEISRLYLPISSSGNNSNSNELVNEYGGHMSSSFPSRSTYNQPGHNKTRDRSESVDTELGAWDADRYYYSGETTAGDGGMYGDGVDVSPVGAVVDGKTASKAEGREYENVFDLGEEEEDATVPGGQRS